jgi:hypothetical protein
MAKKNFRDINPAMAFISDTQNAQDTQDIIHTQNAQNTLDALNTQNTFCKQDTQDAFHAHDTSIAHQTQGTKGQKLPRINMAFSLENLEYLQLISRVEGMSITEYVNTLIRTDSSNRAAEIERAKSILKI